MATPHADHLNVIKTWRTDPIEQANKHLEKVSSNLADIATINRRVAADLGLEGTTARSASSRLDKLATRLLDGSQKVKQLAEVQHKALGLGKKAQSDNEEIQKLLKNINSAYNTYNGASVSFPSAKKDRSLQSIAKAEDDSARAEVDRQAKDVLRVLRESTEALARDFPFQDNEPASRHVSAPPDSAGKGNGGANGSDSGPASGTQAGPTRSATAWHTPNSTPSIGGSGSYTSGHLSPNGTPSDGPALQASHYAPSQLGGFGPSNSTHLPARPSALFNPLAAATIGGGTAVAGYKAYQAMRAARAAQASSPRSEPSSMRSGATIRSTPPSSASIVRGATTAVRSTTPSAGARGATPRGGASGVARPISSSASARSGGILRGATTASRAPAPSPSARGNGIVRGATTAVRKPASSSSAGEAGKVPGARSQTSATREAASTRGAGAASRTSSSISRTAAGRSAATGGKATASSERGGAVARRASAGRAVNRANTASRGETSRALSSLTGRSQGRKKNERRSRSDEPIASAEVRLYEDDRTITFLEAGRRENDRD
ncbi:hypothetical protein A4H34_02625 [Peptidiphaga gingivicola]|uniref:Uncharacterized protein n=1 Tax=Peptidiphaga gingivicola TaxID=2741497 RepID=A0A179B3Y5_9ACTO|nr:hypothetical protein A4H34_02625 [Peptidiphaga gingivicola]